jgi:hypothetical protein
MKKVIVLQRWKICTTLYGSTGHKNVFFIVSAVITTIRVLGSNGQQKTLKYRQRSTKLRGGTFSKKTTFNLSIKISAVADDSSLNLMIKSSTWS